MDYVYRVSTYFGGTNMKTKIPLSKEEAVLYLCSYPEKFCGMMCDQYMTAHQLVSADTRRVIDRCMNPRVCCPTLFTNMLAVEIARALPYENTATYRRDLSYLDAVSALRGVTERFGVSISPIYPTYLVMRAPCLEIDFE